MRKESKYRESCNITLHSINTVFHIPVRSIVKTPRYGKIKIGHKGRPMFDMIIIIIVM